MSWRFALLLLPKQSLFQVRGLASSKRKEDPEICELQEMCESVLPEAVTWPRDVAQSNGLIHEISASCSLCQYELAESLAKRLPKIQQLANGCTKDVRMQLPELPQLPSRVERMKKLLSSCRPQAGKGWKQFDLDTCSVWRLWESQSGAITIILSWVAKGSLLQHIAAVRDADASESLWNGAVWDMWCEHADGISLNRWLEKDPFTRRKFETIMERTLCDCLDHDRPCWVLLERSPQVDKWESFHGKWGAFYIPPCPQGHFRGVTGDGGRVIEPLTVDTCRLSMSLTLHLPAVVRWALTDQLLCLAINLVSRSARKNWDNIINQWDQSGYKQRIKDNDYFYGPVQKRIDVFMSKAGRAPRKE